MEHAIKLNLKTPFSLYDSKGKGIYSKNSNGLEQWWEYNENGNLIYSKNSNGLEEWYDENGRVVHYKNSNGLEEWYDENGNRIPDPNKVTELTLEEIAEKFNIPLNNLRIKD